MEDVRLSSYTLGGYLRYERREQFGRRGRAEFQERIVNALAGVARKLLYGRNKISVAVKRADKAWEATWLSVQALLESWTEERLWALIDREEVRLSRPIKTPEVVGHFIASNTPHLMWSSVARALLIASSSLVRLPSESDSVEAWSKEFMRHLLALDPELETLVGVMRGGGNLDWYTTELICSNSDTILVYGSDDTIDKFKNTVASKTRFVGYGHRVSFGLVLKGADYQKAAVGSALDVAILDQQGCLSPQTILVEADYAASCDFGRALASELDKQSHLFPVRTFATAARIREEIAVAQFQRDAIVISATDLRWTVVVSQSANIQHKSIPGLVYVKPFLGNNIRGEFVPLLGMLQGVSVATSSQEIFDRTSLELKSLGVSYICNPGYLQRPPFEWREDGRDVLRSLL